MRIKHTMIERIQITGPNTESQNAFDYCTKNNYHIVRSGPKQTNSMRYDMTKFLIIAEREKV